MDVKDFCLPALACLMYDAYLTSRSFIGRVYTLFNYGCLLPFVLKPKKQKIYKKNKQKIQQYNNYLCGDILHLIMFNKQLSTLS